MPIFFKRFKRGRILLGTLLLLAGAAFLAFFFFPTEEKKFQAFTRKVFANELSGNTLNLHYTLADPSAYGLEDVPPSLGSWEPEARKQSLSVLENYKKTLESFSDSRLSSQSSFTRAVFLDYLNTELSAGELYLYEEPLGASLGVQAQLPVLFAEYPFRVKKDIEDYLELLSQVPAYFSSILSFEQEKAKNGLFMSDETAQGILDQCREFISDPESNYLLETFQEKIQKITNLSPEEKLDYQTRNASIVTSLVLPAYEDLAAGLEALLGQGINELGLCFWPKGKEYYEYLVRSRVGDARPIAEIEEAIKSRMVEDYSGIAELIQGGALDKAEKEGAQTDASPEEMLEQLRSGIRKDFPLPPQVNTEIKYVPDSLQEYLSPAFYLTPCVDSYTENVIYLNPAGNCEGLDLYTTLAHEGYPGHLYQSVFYQAGSPDVLRALLGPDGYVEGWATYVEMYAYSLWDGDPDAAALAQKNRSFTLGAAALLDIGIHYRGYTPQETAAFLKALGFSEESAASLYRSILEAPANYLPYYVGCLNFYDLRDYAKEQMGESFSLKEFHQTVLEAGPAPFSLVKQYLAAHLEPSAS